MSDLNDLASAAQSSRTSQNVYRSRSAPFPKNDRMGQIVQGFFFSLGWLPVAVVAGLIVIFVAQQYNAYQLGQAMQKVNEQLDELRKHFGR